VVVLSLTQITGNIMDNLHTLYADGINGVREYRIWSEGSVIKILANGVMYEEEVTHGKVNRTLDEQVTLRILSRVRIKLDNGFVYDKSDLSGVPTNQLGYFMPMLAERLDKLKQKPRGTVYVQPKFDGHRCLLNSEGAYSRRGKAIDTIPDLFEHIKMPEGITLDGELYVHNTPLQTIASWAKKNQKGTEKLKYFIYDCIVHDELDMPYEQRLKLLGKLQVTTKRSKLVTTRETNIAKVQEYFHAYRKRNLEGAMIRLHKSEYAVGKRSKGLLKVKHYEDAEFECIDIHANRLGWAILNLRAHNGRLFTATAPGPVDVKMATYQNKHDYIGNSVTCEYACLTNEGIPFQPVATRWLTVL